MPSPFSIVADTLSNAHPEVKRSRNWREDLRARVGSKLHEILLDLAEGKAWFAELPDGQISAPIVPSSDVRARCAMFLHESLYGRSVAQTEVAKADEVAADRAAVHALSDAELEAEVHQVLEARKSRTKRLAPLEYAEFTPMPLPERDVALIVWESEPTEEQE
jgi:hypothetical protein